MIGCFGSLRHVHTLLLNFIILDIKLKISGRLARMKMFASGSIGIGKMR